MYILCNRKGNIQPNISFGHMICAYLLQVTFRHLKKKVLITIRFNLSLNPMITEKKENIDSINLKVRIFAII